MFAVLVSVHTELVHPNYTKLISHQLTITTLIIHHPIIFPFQPQNFYFSHILPSIDIWHLPLKLISSIGYLTALQFFSSFQFFKVSIIVIFPFLVFFIPGLLQGYLFPNHLFLYVIFYIFSSI